MAKIVYNDCYGGFGLSLAAVRLYANLNGGTGCGYFGDIERNDPILVQVVEQLGKEANSHYSNLKIRELPAGTQYRIDEYDGMESVVTKEEAECEWYTA